MTLIGRIGTNAHPWNWMQQRCDVSHLCGYRTTNIMIELNTFPVEDVWGVGPQYAAFLHRHGLHTALQLRNTNDLWVRRHMTVMGLRTVQVLRGELRDIIDHEDD